MTNIQKNKTLQLVAMSDVPNAFIDAPAEITWSTSNSRIISIDENGLLKGLASGMATVTVTVVTPFRTLKATIAIKVS